MNGMHGDAGTPSQIGAAGMANEAAQGVPTTVIGGHALQSMGVFRMLSETRFQIQEVVPDHMGAPDLREGSLALVIHGPDDHTHAVVRTIDRLRAAAARVRICVIADRFDVQDVALACAAGANGFCLTSADREVLTRSLELIMLGETLIPSDIVRTVLAEASSHGIHAQRGSGLPCETARGPYPTTDRLSARESEILRSLMEGAPNKIIARQFGVTEATVKVHVKAILRKIGAKNRTQAAMWAAGYITPPQPKRPSAAGVHQ